MERAAVNIAAAGPSKHKRCGRSPQVMGLRNHIGDLVKSATDEIHELKFRDRAQTGERCAKSRADNCRLSDGCVNDALGAEAVNESVCDFEGAAVNSNVFAQAKNRGITFHLFPDSLADGFEISELRHVKFDDLV